MIKNIIFDIGNVLFEFNPQKQINQFSFDQQKKEKLQNIIFSNKLWGECDRGTYTIREYMELLCTRYPTLEKEIRMVLNKDWVKMHIIKKDSIRYLKELKEQGFNIYLLSNISEEAYEYIKQYDFMEEICGGVYSYQIKFCKPEQEIYKRIIEKYNICLNESIYIDDKKRNIQVAEKIGIHSIVFDHLEQVKKRVEKSIKESEMQSIKKS